MMEELRSPANKDKDPSLDAYFDEIASIPVLKPEEEVALAKRIRKGDKKALKKMVYSNLRFVVRIAYEYKNHGLPLGDLINEGNLGLIKAAHRFDETKGFKFISYAVWWIRQSIMQAIIENARLVRLPLNRVSSLNKVGKKYSSLEQQYEREPTPEEIATSLDLPASEVSRMMQLSNTHLSLEAYLSEENKYSLLEVTENPNMSSPEQPLNRESMKSELKRALCSLTRKESEILCLYFGLDVDRQYNLDEIGKLYRITRERVRQIKEKALFRLRHQSRSKFLRQYLGESYS
jgi:RNA polymerase primary sigma factor